jgi:hypothetical protein
MGAIANVIAAPLSVDPGGEVSCRLTVRNDGVVVDAFAVEVLGATQAWATVNPPELALMPGEEGVVDVTFAPPRSWATAAGVHPFAMRVLSREDPAGSAVEEGTLEVASFADAGAELLPRTSHARGRRKATHEIALDNRGNATAAVTVQPLDPDERLSFHLESPVVEVDPGCTRTLRLRVSARKRFWRGAPVMLPFQVHAESAGAPPTVLDAQLQHEAAVPKWLVRALVALLVVASLLAGLWFTVLRPTIESTARSAADEAASGARKEAAAAAAAQQEQIDALAAAGGGDPAAKPSAKPSGKPSAKPDPKGDPKPKDPGTKPPAEPAPVDPLGFPLVTRVAATAGEQSPKTVLSEKQLVSVTDLLLQNPAGDTGLVSVRRGDTVIYTARLENFRDLDLHLVAPLEFAPGETLRLDVTCQNSEAEPRPCTPAVTVTGFARNVP